MSGTGIVRVKFETLKSFYPTYKTLPKELQAFMDGLNKVSAGNTPCCVQVSHALNKSGQLIPPKSFRRSNSKIGPSFYYLLAVDELEQYLSANFGRGEEIKKTASGATRSMADMKTHLAGKKGILVFRNEGAGHHTELWEDTHILQDGKAVSGGGAVMNEANIFGQARVLFWPTIPEKSGLQGVPSWLRGWWKVWDGNTYYYHFTNHHIATYVKVAPSSVSLPPLKMPLNEGTVTISQNATQVVINWNPADGGATTETFSSQGTNPTKMHGVSNRYSPLVATKM